MQFLNRKELRGVFKEIAALRDVSGLGTDVEVEPVAFLLGIGPWLQVGGVVRHCNWVAVVECRDVADTIVRHSQLAEINGAFRLLLRLGVCEVAGFDDYR